MKMDTNINNVDPDKARERSKTKTQEKKQRKNENYDDQSTDNVYPYFESDAPGVVRCLLCKQSMARRLSFLKKHLREKHSKLNEIEHKDIEDDDPNCYTEVVYLEDEAQVPERTPDKVKKIDNHSKQIQKKSEIRKRRHSPHPMENEEVENFGRYITSLMKKLPRELCTQLQMDIVNLIMTAKLDKMKSSKDISQIIVSLPDESEENEEKS